MSSVPEVSVHELAAVHGEGAAVVDVREPEEYAEGHVPGAILMPLSDVPGRYGELPRAEPLYLVCAAGGRSLQAAKYLNQLGYEVRNVAGGTRDWIANGFPVETGAPTS